MAAAAAGLSKPGPPSVNNPTETSLDVWWTAVPGATGYTVQVKEAANPDWSHARSLQVPGDSTKLSVQGLNPTTTYEFRLIADKDGTAGDPSDSVIADTLVANCGPKCVIQ